MSFEALAKTNPLGLSPEVLQRREESTVRVESKRKQNDGAYLAANIYLSDLNKAFSYGAYTAKVFLLLNQARLFNNTTDSYGHEDPDYMSVHQGLRQAFGINHNQWMRGINNLEAAGLVAVKRAKGVRNRVKLLTRKVPGKRAKR